MTSSTSPVLVTGGSGFIAGHVIAALLASGHTVRTTARSRSSEAAIRAQLARLGTRDPGASLEVVAADLTRDEGWDAAVAGCRVVLHVASPVTPGHVADEREVIVPAREGTLRVLRAAHAADVDRVVLTSAFHAIGFGWGRTDRTFTDDDWSPLEGDGMDAYGRSKVLAERAAWEYAAQTGLELVVLNPVAVIGPVTSARLSGGNAVVRRILVGELSRFPDIWLPIVDVREVAAAHVAATTVPEAAGQRFLIAGQGGLTLAQIAAALRSGLGPQAAQVGTAAVPSWLVRAAALFRPELRGVVPDLGVRKNIDGGKARRVLGTVPRPARASVVDAARSMLALDT